MVDSELDQINDCKIPIHCLTLSMKGQCGEQAGKFDCCVVGKDTSREF